MKTRGKERRELAFVFGKIMALVTFLKWPQKHISNGLEMEQKKKKKTPDRKGGPVFPKCVSCLGAAR